MYKDYVRAVRGSVFFSYAFIGRVIQCLQLFEKHLQCSLLVLLGVEAGICFMRKCIKVVNSTASQQHTDKFVSMCMCMYVTMIQLIFFNRFKKLIFYAFTH